MTLRVIKNETGADAIAASISVHKGAPLPAKAKSHGHFINDAEMPATSNDTEPLTTRN